MPSTAAGVQCMSPAACLASLAWPASIAQLRCVVAPVGVGFRPALFGVRGGARPSKMAHRKSSPARAVLQRDDAQAALQRDDAQAALQRDDAQAAGPSPEQELKIISEVLDEGTSGGVEKEGEVFGNNKAGNISRLQRRIAKRKKEQKTYLLAAIASTTGFTALSAAAVVYRFVWQMPESGQIPYPEVFGTFSLAAGAAVGMEYWARWAHKALWHASLWHMHESHHKPRDGPFETNDVFAIINAVPAIALMLYGFLNPGIGPAVCFGAGLGITMFGIAYMFVHDGLVHRRFPVGPIAEVPYLQKVAAAHQLHHADLFEGVPYGLFLGPKELENVGGGPELEKLMKQKAKSKADSVAK